MKIVITQDQIKLIKESTNRSAKLLGKFYDIEGYHAYYLGDSMIQSRVRFTPKDFDNPMTPRYGESICNWKIDKPFSSVPGDVTFVAMNLPDSFNVPLMDHIGNTGELEKYLKELHMGEVEEFIKRIIERRNNPLKESVDRKKKLFIDLLGQDLIDSIRTITSPKQLPKEFSKSLGSSRIQSYIDAYGPLYYFVFDGEPFIYKDRVSPKGEEYEMFVNRKGESFFNNQISNRLGLSDVGLKFLDVINTFHNDEEPLNESVDKNKKFLTNVMGKDFTGKIKEVKDPYDVPLEFGETIGDDYIRRVLNYFGPLHLVDIDGKKYLYQYRTDEEDGDYEWFHDEHGFNYVDGEIPEQLGLNELGLKFSDIIDMFYNQEGEPLNEENDMSGKSKENIKLENLLKRVLENKEFEYSFTDRTEGLWDGNEYENIEEDYTFKYHMVVNYVLGVGSGSVADIDVIIDDIILDGESVYDGWSEIGYSENVWYIEHLHEYLKDDVFNVFPFSIYPTYYGHDEEI